MEEHKKITKEIYCEILNIFPNWKELNNKIKEHYSRGINFHEAFSEIIVGYNFNLNLDKNSSADLIDNYEKKYQIKGSSDYKNDLSSFGPNSSFDYLIYCGLNELKTELYIWKIDINFLKKIYVNNDETFEEQQKQKRRPRFSIYKKIVVPKELTPVMKVNLYEEKQKNNC